jgi:hypothetical protein
MVGIEIHEMGGQTVVTQQLYLSATDACYFGILDVTDAAFLVV